MMRALLIGVVVATAVLMFLAVPLGGGSEVSADNGPHVQGAGATADGCAGCHRAHTGQDPNLLRVAEESLCYACHGTGGSGANTIVQEGKLLGVAPNFTALRGGGFDTALIDTDDPSGVSPDAGAAVIGALSTPEAVTSNHSTDGTSQTVWGSGAWGSGVGGTFALRCTSCHDPHGNGNFRILKPDPNGVGSDVNITDEVTKDYDTTNYFDTAPLGANVASWCSQCHTRYLAASGSEGNPAPTPEDIYVFRHRSNGSGTAPNCLKCHASHGTNAVTTDGGFSESVQWPGGGAASGENTRLLKMNNRGVCQKCHDK